MAFDWGSTSVSYLKGSSYCAPNFGGEDCAKGLSSKQKENEILTLEHVDGWKYGDNYFFIDIPNVSTPSSIPYVEYNPRFSSKKILGTDYGTGLLSDVLVTAQYNRAGKAGDFPNHAVYLYGLAVDLNVPGLNFFQTHFYVRDDRNLEGTSTQLTLVWGSNFKAGIDWEFAGFLDYAGAEGKKGADGSTFAYSEANLLTQPQLLAKLTPNLGLGLEYQYWSNKLGVKKANESLPQLLIKASF